MLITRRRMLLTSLGGSALLTGLAAFRSSRDSLVTRRGRALGSDVTMTVVCESTRRAERALEAAFAELETVEQVMSLYRPDSQICRLNQDKLLTDPHPYLLEVLAGATWMSRQSAGAFDVTVQPLWDLYSKCRRSGCLPTDSQIEMARQAIDWKSVQIGSKDVRLRNPAASITLNGIAQGYASDRVLAVLRAAGIEQALINAGEIASLGVKADARQWTVGIQHPRESNAYSSVVPLDGRSLATSGDYQTTFVPDFSRHHIFDPRTGQSPPELASVSILAPTGMQADAFSTAAMVLGAVKTLSLVQRLPHVDAFLVFKSGRTWQTDGFPAAVIG